MNEKIDLRNLTQKQMQELTREMGQPSFRGKQVFTWVQKGVASFDEMRNIPKAFRAELEEKTQIRNMQPVRVQQSAADGTQKFLFELSDGNCIETVFMKYSYGNSLCISSQVGCRMGCAFCASAKGGLVRGLTAGEMIGQVLEAEKETGEHVSRVVVMGIGEPLDNYEQLGRFIEVIHDKSGHGMSLRNITVSTCGLTNKMQNFAEDYPQVNLAVSLHAPSDEKRKKIMPIARKYSIERLMQSCKEHTKKTGRRITFEYALIDGLNDDDATIGQLIRLVKGMLCHINLIPLNRVAENKLKGSRPGRVKEIASRLEENGIAVTVRRKLGEDIDAACGQLRLKKSK